MSGIQIIKRRRFAPPRPRRAATTLDQAGRYGAQIAVIGLFLFAVFLVLHQAMFFFAPFFAAIVFGLVLGPAATRLERLGAPPGAAAAALVVLVLAATAALFAALSGPVSEWIARAPEAWQKLSLLLRDIRDQLEGISEARENLEDALGASGPTVTTEDRVAQITGLLSLAPAVAGQALIFLGTLYFFLASRTELRRTVLSFCVSRGTRCRFARIFRDVEADVAGYITAIAIINVCFGVCVAAAMAMLGMPSPVLWGVLAGILNFVPYLGPALIALMIFAAGLISFDHISAALGASLTYVALNTLEGQFVTPSLIGRRMTLNPLLVFSGLTFWLWLWGAVGAFLAVPFLLITRTVIVHLLPQRPEQPRIPARRTTPAPAPPRQAA